MLVLLPPLLQNMVNRDKSLSYERRMNNLQEVYKCVRFCINEVRGSTVSRRQTIENRTPFLFFPLGYEVLLALLGRFERGKQGSDTSWHRPADYTFQTPALLVGQNSARICLANLQHKNRKNGQMPRVRECPRD